MAELTEVTRESFEAQVLKAEKTTLVYYNAPWCKQGQEMLETVKAAADEVGDKMLYFSVDTDKEDYIILNQGVRTVPTVHLVSGGQCVGQLRGVVSKLDLLGKVSNVLAEEDTGGDDSPTEDTEPPADPA